MIRHGRDIARLRELDQKLWVALACPTRGIEFDPRTLDLIDSDGDGRIRPPELIAACEWACERLRDADLLVQPADTLALDDLTGPQAQPPGGPSLADEARRVLALAGSPDAPDISLAQVTERADAVFGMRFNGDGIVSAATAEDDLPAREAIAQAMRTHGSLADRSGEPGIDRKHAQAFFTDLQAQADWLNGDGSRLCDSPELRRATEAVNAVRAKVEDFFTRCHVAAYDPPSAELLNVPKATYESLASVALDGHSESIAALPLAPVAAGRALPLGLGVNPAWAEAIERLRTQALVPLFAHAGDRMDEAAWQELKRRVEPCQSWLAARPTSALADLDATAIDGLLGAQEAVMALIDEDERTATHNARLLELEKLLRLRRDLKSLLENFVSFKAFYRREGAVFQAGTLFLDARSCDLCVQVADVKQHAALAGLAKTCLAYCECKRGKEKMNIVAAFTAGDVDFLFVGRNGVFYDRKGNDWDATITRLIENPTSVAQAFFSPYKKFLRVLEEQVAKRAAASEASAQGTLGTLASTLATADKAAVPPAGAPAATPRLPGARIDVGTVAALGVALGSISAVMVAVFSKFIDLGHWIPVALLGIVLAISGPSMLIAWLKLRQRSLGPILDAGGWAINGRMLVNVRLGASLSKTAHVPPQNLQAMRDPFANRSRGWRWALFVLLLLAAGLAWAWANGWTLAPLQSWRRLIFSQ